MNVFSVSATVTATTSSSSPPLSPLSPETNSLGSLLLRSDKHHLGLKLIAFIAILQCHFVYIGTPDCEDCDGKRVYKSVDCKNK